MGVARMGTARSPRLSDEDKVEQTPGPGYYSPRSWRTTGVRIPQAKRAPPAARPGDAWFVNSGAVDTPGPASYDPMSYGEIQRGTGSTPVPYNHQDWTSARMSLLTCRRSSVRTWSFVLVQFFSSAKIFLDFFSLDKAHAAAVHMELFYRCFEFGVSKTSRCSGATSGRSIGGGSE